MSKFKFTRSQWRALYDCVTRLGAIFYEIGNPPLCLERVRLAECGGTIDIGDARLVSEAQSWLEELADRDEEPRQTRAAANRALAAMRAAGASPYSYKRCECAVCETEK